MKKLIILSLATSAIIIGGSMISSPVSAQTTPPTPTVIPAANLPVEPSATVKSDEAAKVDSKETTGTEKKAEVKHGKKGHAKKHETKGAGYETKDAGTTTTPTEAPVKK